MIDKTFKICLKIICLTSIYLLVVALSAFLTFPSVGAKENGKKDISVLIVPHHLVAKDYIAAAFEYVSKNQEIIPDRIILMGPNHFFKGKGKTIAAAVSWQTQYGEIKPDKDFIKKLVLFNFASEEKSLLENDHAITNLLPFIKQFYPDALLVPLLMREPITYEYAAAFGKVLAESLDEKTLIIASIDFSHYLPKAIADKHDEESIKALYNLDFEFFRKKIDADSPHILMVLTRYLKQTGYIKFNLLSHTNSAILTGNPDEKSTTSHIIGFFEK
ncbi:AmmeMemoRadiSam system protein B [Candidatus Peregrinibacteria bacterium]|nr:AmmeMemoRadiSam system protein B [Candidatus Peregrinibacteria bacterium]